MDRKTRDWNSKPDCNTRQEVWRLIESELNVKWTGIIHWDKNSFYILKYIRLTMLWKHWKALDCKPNKLEVYNFTKLQWITWCYLWSLSWVSTLFSQTYYKPDFFNTRNWKWPVRSHTRIATALGQKSFHNLDRKSMGITIPEDLIYLSDQGETEWFVTV